MRKKRLECKAEETNFRARFEKHFLTLRTVYNPLDNATYDTRRYVKRTSDAENEVKSLIRRHVEPSLQADVYDDTPKNCVLGFDVMRVSLFGGSKPKVGIAGAFVSSLAELIKDGETATPADIPQLDDLKRRVIINTKVFYYIVAYSPTGWTPETRQHLAGPNYIIGLCDSYGGGLRVYVPPETRVISRRVFDLTTAPEKLALMRQLLKDGQYELIMDDFTDEFASQKLALDRDVVAALFEEVLSEDKFVILDARARPLRLIREYNRPTPLPITDDLENAPIIKYRDIVIRDEQRIACVLRDIETLDIKERDLLDEGAVSSEARRQSLAHIIKELRHRRAVLRTRLQLYEKRLTILRNFVNNLEMLKELKAEPVPDHTQIESVYAQAGAAREQLKELAAMTNAVHELGEKDRDKAELGDIMSELGSEKEEPEPESKPLPEIEPPPIREKEQEPKPRQLEGEEPMLE